jgi:hypothetical protein
MTLNDKVLALVIALVLGFQLVVPFTSPTFAQDIRKGQNRELLTREPAEAPATTKQQDREVPVGGVVQGREDFTPAQMQETENFAQRVSQALSLNSDGTVGLNVQKMGPLSSEQSETLNRFVTDLNERRIGIAISRDDGTVMVYGNSRAAANIGTDATSPKSSSSTAAQPMNSWWVNSQGVHIYIDPYWTALLADLQSWAIGTIAGLIATALCGTGVGCVAVTVAVSFVWWVVWSIIKKYYPSSFTIHAPWWGWVTVQVWSSRSWLNGATFRTNLWT